LKLKALLAVVLLSFLSSAGLVAAAPESSTAAAVSYRKFVIYYGWYFDSEGRPGPDIDRIISAKPEYVISPYHTSTGQVNLKPEVMDKFHESGIKVLIYVATGNGWRNLDGALEEMKTGFDNGADGVMLDEVAMLHEKWQVGSEKIVIANPGSILVSESVMSVSDILSFEHQWRLAPHIDWFSKYPATRFMGISSNDIANVMGYRVDGDVAASDTVESWQSGVAYHYSTDKYTDLPPWFGQYQTALDEHAASGSKLHEVSVRTVGMDGKEIKGLWVEVARNGRVVVTGFSPTKFMLPEGGNYQVGAANYQNFIFSRWQDGAESSPRDVSVGGDLELTAVYKNDLANLRVESFDSMGNSIRGLYVSVSRDGAVVSSGQTPLHLQLPADQQYSLQANSSGYFQFARWDDGTNVRQVNLTQDSHVAAYYDGAPAGINAYSACSQDYQQQVAGSMLEGGPLAGLLELHMRKSLMASAGCAFQ
jgi:hypothetical protein